MGIKLRATTKAATREKVTVRAICLNITPSIPSRKSRGRNTHMVVSVEAVIAIPTSLLPSVAPSIATFPSSLSQDIPPEARGFLDASAIEGR